MRIIAGKFKSRLLKTLANQTTRPTLDQVKESFFSRIGPFFDGGRFLDIFGGSGAMAFEFISRGGEKAVILEKNFQAYQIICENKKLLQLDSRVDIIKGDYKQKLSALTSTFDFVYIDPPYELDVYEDVLHRIIPLIHHQTLICMEMSKDKHFKIDEKYEIVRQDDYRNCRIVIVKKR